MLDSLIIALSMYSAIPMPRVDWREDNMRWALGCLPVVGVLSGGLVFGWTQLALWASATPLLAAALAVFLPILLSGGLHMDGFLDATDAIFSRRDREKKLQIMKDPNCGPFAVLCCSALLLLELAAWYQLFAAAPALLPAACTVYLLSRSLVVVAGSRFPYTPSSTLGVLFASRAAKGVSVLGGIEVMLSLVILLGAGWLGGNIIGLIAACVAALCAGLLFIWYRHMVEKQFGGITGDLLGFFVELSQGVMLLVLALSSLFLCR